MKYFFYFISLGILFSSIIYCQVDSTIIEDLSTPLDIEVIFFGGTAYPYFPTKFKDYWSSDWSAGIGGGISFQPGDLGYVAIYPTFEFSKMIFAQSGFRDDHFWNKYSKYSSRGSMKISNVMVNLKGSFSSTKKTTAPYFLIGLGRINYSSSRVIVNDNGVLSFDIDSKAGFAWTFGVGLEVPFNERIGAFIEGKSIIGFVNEGKSIIGVDNYRNDIKGIVDPVRQYFPVNVGVKLRF